MQKRIRRYFILVCIMSLLCMIFGGCGNKEASDKGMSALEMSEAEREATVKGVWLRWYHFSYQFFCVDQAKEGPIDGYFPYNPEVFSSVDDIMEQMKQILTPELAAEYYETYLGENSTQLFIERDGVLYRACAAGVMEPMPEYVVITEYEADRMEAEIVLYANAALTDAKTIYTVELVNAEEGWRIKSMEG